MHPCNSNAQTTSLPLLYPTTIAPKFGPDLSPQHTLTDKNVVISGQHSLAVYTNKNVAISGLHNL